MTTAEHKWIQKQAQAARWKTPMRDFLRETLPHLPRSLLEAAVMGGFLLALALWLPELF